VRHRGRDTLRLVQRPYGDHLALMDGDPTETWVTIFRPVNAVADLKVMKNTREEALEALIKVCRS
jgi:hypothetical protein